MKKTTNVLTSMLIVLGFFSLSSCSGDNDEPKKESNTPSKEVSVLINAKICDITGNIQSENIKIEIYEGNNLEKREAFDGVAYKTGTNSQVKPIMVSDFSCSFTLKSGVNYLIAVICQGKKYSFTKGAYSFINIVAPNKYEEYVKIFSANSRTNVAEDWNADTNYIPDCLNGKWGDSKEIIKALETNIISDEGPDFIAYGYKYNNLTTYYFDSNGFNHGFKSKYYSVNVINGGATLLGFRSTVEKMIEKYGQPSSFTDDILSMEPSSSEFNRIGESVIKGKSITYYFNDRKISTTIKGDYDYYTAYFGKASAWTITEDYYK